MIGAGAVVALLIGGGGYVVVAGSDGNVAQQAGGSAGSARPIPTSATQPLADPSFLLAATGAKPLSAGSWTVSTTAEGSKAPERSFSCQGQRFADPTGVRTWVRRFSNTATKATAVQYVELSADAGSAEHAYSTIVGWLGNCVTPQQQLVASFATTGLGERGTVAVFAQPVGGDKERYRTIVVTGTGSATMVLEHNVVAATVPAAKPALNTASAALQQVCAETEATCSKSVSMKPELLPAVDEPSGFMAPIDLPVVSRLSQPWVGVDADTTDGSGCEKLKAKMTLAKAREAKGRTYVVPNASVPAEFGIDTMVVEFGSPPAAQAFVTAVRTAVDKCASTQSNAKVTRTLGINAHGVSGQTWRVKYDLGGSSLSFRIGIVRTGRRASHLMFPVTPGLDVPDRAFADVVIRAGERSLAFR